MPSAFEAEHNPHRPSALLCAQPRRRQTLSLAVPGSILYNAQTRELRSNLAGQIARAAAIYAVDEVIVFHEPISGRQSYIRRDRKTSPRHTDQGHSSSSPANHDPHLDEMDAMLVHILEYLETPPYLRRALIPYRPSLSQAGLLPPLDMPHHPRKYDECLFREGVVIDPSSATPQKKRRKSGSDKADTVLVDTGGDEPLHVHAAGSQYLPGARVTVRMSDSTFVKRTVPKMETGTYWGYAVRYASCLQHVFTNSSFSEPYDLTIGTSERGKSITSSPFPSTFSHALIVFGGLSGLELTIETEPALGLNATDAQDLFDLYVNVCPRQASRTIRTEEAIPIAFAQLCPFLDSIAENSS